MKIQSNISWYKAISKVNPIFYKYSFNNPLTTIPLTIPQRPSLYTAEKICSNNREQCSS